MAGASLDDRRTGPRDAPGFGYLYRKVTPAQAVAIAASRAAGASIDTLALAYGVERRTIYRAIALAALPVADVRVADWHAEFVITPDGPVRATAWHPVAE
jgi:hypothetical protein